MNKSARTDLLLCLLLALVVAAALLPALENDFVRLDDPAYLRENPRIRELSWSSVITLFTSLHQYAYKPLTELSFALEYRFFGLDPFALHLTNLILHILNTLLVFSLVRGLGRTAGVAFIAALFFGLHPLRVESVAWATERKDVLYGLFFLGSLIAYLRYLEFRGRRYYLLSIFLFAVSCLPKPQGLALPALLLLFDYFRGRKFSGRVWREKLPFLLVSLIFFSVNFAAQVTAGHFGRNNLFAIFPNLLYTNYSLVLYLSRMAFPVRLSCFYTFPDLAGWLTVSQITLAPAIVVALSLVVINSARRTREIVFGALFFLLNLLIVLHLVRTPNPAVSADRYTYIASIGVYYLAAAGIGRLWARDRAGRRVALATAVALAAIFFFILTRQRCLVWRDDLTLWADAARKNPALALPHFHRGIHFREAGDLEAAMASYRAALRLDPRDYRTHYNLANILADLGRLSESIFHYQQALLLKPDDAESYNNLGVAFYKLGEPERAGMAFAEALRLKPDFPDPYSNLGLISADQNRLEEAGEYYLQALRLRPGFADASRNLVLALARRGDYTGVIYHARQYLQLAPGDARIHNLLGVALSKEGRSGEALVEYREALRLAPDYAEAHNNLGIEYAALGRYEEAVRSYREALRLQPNYPDVWNNLGLDLLARGRTEEAIESYRASLEAVPGFAAGHYQLARLLEGKGRTEEALFHYRRAYRFDPGHPAARARLIQLEGRPPVSPSSEK